MMHLDYRDARPIYTQTIENIRSQIAAGVLEPGDRLPSVRELAGQLAINPNTIQRAYRELELQGIIATMPGKGCFVCPRTAANQTLWQNFDNAVQELLAQGVTRQEILQHLMEGGTHHAPNE